MVIAPQLGSGGGQPPRSEVAVFSFKGGEPVKLAEELGGGRGERVDPFGPAPHVIPTRGRAVSLAIRATRRTSWKVV